MPRDLITEMPRLRSLSVSNMRSLIQVSINEETPWPVCPSSSISTRLVQIVVISLVLYENEPACIYAVTALVTEYPAFSSDLIIELSFLFIVLI